LPVDEQNAGRQMEVQNEQESNAKEKKVSRNVKKEGVWKTNGQTAKQGEEGL
jgi:hypothetical protein